MRPLSLEDSKKAREEKIEKAKTLLASAVGQLQSGDDWKEMLSKLARGGRFSIRRLSFRNQLLVEAQSPGTSHVASYLAWQIWPAGAERGAQFGHIGAADCEQGQ